MDFFKGTSKGPGYSAALHGVLLLFLIFGLPDFFHRQIDAEPMAISVDILPIAPMSNVKPAEKPAEKPVKQIEKASEKKATQEATPEKKPDEETPVPLPSKDVVKQDKPKPKKEKPKKKDDSLDSILKSVKASAKAEESKKPTDAKPTETKQAVSQNYNPDVPLSMSEKDSIRNQFQACWQMPAGAKDDYTLIVTLHIEVNEDGSVTKVELVHDESRYNSDTFFRSAADAAIRAVNRCSPLKNLPADRYGGWKSMTLTFDPKDALY